VLVFSHRVSGAKNASEYFHSAAEARNASSDVSFGATHKFSLLASLDAPGGAFRNASGGGALTLWLVYPELRPGANFNAWAQASSPTAERPVAAFVPAHTAFAGVNGGRWGGLRASASNNTLTDGTADVATNWWFAVGAYYLYTGLAPFCPPGVAGGLPGPQAPPSAPLECAGAACATPGASSCPQTTCCTRWVQVWALPAAATTAAADAVVTPPPAPPPLSVGRRLLAR
jgi:hypothetical protein